MNDDVKLDDLPQPAIKRPGGLRFSLIWLVPLIAAIIGAVLVARTALQAGPTIHITFDTAEGIETGKTEVRYKDVVIGRVGRLTLSEDHSHVIATVALIKSAGKLAVEDTRFWIVRPRIGIGGVSGIGTLLSGAYIGVDVGNSTEERDDFEGLDKPPAVTHEKKGRRYTLHTYDAGSLTIGSPVYYRRVAVGQIVDSVLDDDGRRVTAEIFIDSPYDRFVTSNSRFWNAGGVDLSLSSSGLKVNTQSLATVLAGGIAFQQLSDSDPGTPAPEKAEFELFGDQAAALAPPDGPSLEALLVFRQSTRGLSAGTNVDFQGINLGTVKTIEPEYDRERKSFYTNVVLELFPERLGPAYRTLAGLEPGDGDTARRIFRRFIDQGLHGQLRSGNLITGQLYVALFFKPGSRAILLPRKDARIEIPTAPGSLEEIQTKIESIVDKINAIPFDEIGSNLRDTLKSSNSLIKQLDHELAPQAKALLDEAARTIRSLDQNLASPDSPLQQDSRRTLEQVNRAAASLRALADYLEQHPESLLRGKPASAEPAADSGRAGKPDGDQP
ncbi:MAG: MlaD family protein [Nevskia sp.]